MPISAQLSRLVVYGLPLAFVVFSWFASASLPELLESEESFVTGLHARSSGIVTPRSTISTSVWAVDWQRSTGATSYTQLPTAPRLLNYLLLGAGLRDGSSQKLIISLIGTAVTALLLWRLFGQPALLVVPLAVVLDYAGFLAWTLNASRIWIFVLFFGLVLTVRSGRPYWFGALAFCLIQLDFRVATFVGATALAFALMVHRSRGWRFVVAGLVGAALPLDIFVFEVLVFYGWEELLHELKAGQAWLSTLGPSNDGFRYLFQAGHGPVLLLQTVARDSHSVIVFLMVVAGLVSSLFALSRDWLGEPHRFLANLTVSAAVGTVVASWTLYTPFVEGFVGATLPLASFLIAPALGALALELRTVLAKAWDGRHLGTITTAVVLVPLVMSSIVQYDPPVEVGVYRRVQSGLRQSTITNLRVESWSFWPQTVFARTDGGTTRGTAETEDHGAAGRRPDP